MLNFHVYLLYRQDLADAGIVKLMAENLSNESYLSNKNSSVGLPQIACLLHILKVHLEYWKW